MIYKEITLMVYWVNPETGEIITPQEYIRMNSEERKKLVMQFKDINLPNAFVYCPLCKRWEEATPGDSLCAFAENCKEYRILDTLQLYNNGFVKYYVKNKDKMDEKYVFNYVKKRIKIRLKELIDSDYNIHYYNALIRELELYCELFPDYRKLNELKEKIKSKILTMNLKGDRYDNQRF